MQSEGRRGGKRYGSGRTLLSVVSFTKSQENRSKYMQNWQKNHGRLYLRKDIHQTWKRLKAECLYSSDTTFARHLLSLELRRQARMATNMTSSRGAKKKGQDDNSSTCSTSNKSFMTSTPMKRAIHVHSPHMEQSPITIQDTSYDADVDITGATFHYDSSSSSSTTDTTTSSTESDSDDESIRDATALNDALEDLDEDREADTSISTDEEEEEVLCMEAKDSDSDAAVDVSEFELSGYLDPSGVVDVSELELPGYLDPSGAVDGGTPSVVRPTEASATPSVTTPTEASGEVRVTHRASDLQHFPCVTEPTGEGNKFSRWEERPHYKEELQLVQGTKVICTLDLLVQVFAEKCRHQGCQRPTTVNYTLCGTSALIYWRCIDGHSGKFCSSHKASGLLANNLQSSAAVLLSGNNYEKIAKFAHFLGLSFISNSTFYRAQRLYLLPAVSEWWKWQQGKIFEELTGKDLVVSGDGQCDSPGFTAKHLCYFLMEMTTGYIIDLEVMDKREVDMKSVNMEKEALLKIMGRLKNTLNLIELVTDASATIKKAIASMFAEVFHSLDVWHKAKSIKKCIAKVGSAKGMEKISKWSEHIIRHFWHCSSTASQLEPRDDEDQWISLLHHVCGQHEWLGGKCSHGEIPDDERALPWFDKREKDFETLQNIILEPSLLDSLKYYTRFRHTGSLERANSMSLMYASKRCSFTKKGFTARKCLAVIDWNYHMDTKAAVNSFGETCVSRKYNQRTKTWNVKILKEEKDYQYIWMLLAKVFRLRLEDDDNVQRVLPMEADDPRRITPTIAQCEPVSSMELYARHQSRSPQQEKS